MDGLPTFQMLYDSIQKKDVSRPKKGIYPYDYVKGETFEDVDKLMLNTIKPIESDFKSLLQTYGVFREGCADDDSIFQCATDTAKEYERFLADWDSFSCTNLKDYTMQKMKLDVCIVADVFERFRSGCYEKYKIDPAHCYSTPGLTCAAGMKYTCEGDYPL